MILAVILAAGGARRFGSAKQLAALDGEPMVRRAARVALAAGASPVIVVVGAYAAEVRAALAEVDAIVEVNDAWESGLASSLSAGLSAALRLDAALDGVLVMVADQPLVEVASIRRLLAAFTGRAGAVASRYEDGLGVPAIIGRDHLAAVSGVSGDRGAGSWLRAHVELVVAVESEGTAEDVDTPADLARVRARLISLAT